MDEEILIWSTVIEIFEAMFDKNSTSINNLMRTLAVQCNQYPKSFDNVKKGMINLLEYNYSASPRHDDNAELLAHLLSGLY